MTDYGNVFYTHCGSTNHGMLIKWSTADGVNLDIQATTYLQADLDIFSNNDTDAQYYIDPAVFDTDAGTADGYFYTADSIQCATDVNTCDFPQVQMLIILVNENDDCTSSMVCKDGMRSLIDVKGSLTLCDATNCSIDTIIANWNLLDTSGNTVYVD